MRVSNYTAVIILGMYKCWHCGQQVCWTGDFKESEIEGSEEYPENDRVVSYYTCPCCGSEFEFRQGSKEEF